MMSIEMDLWLAGLEAKRRNNGISSINLALAAPDRLTAAEVGERDRVAAATGLPFGMVSAGWEDAKIRFQADMLRQNPVMEKWLQDAPENIAFAIENPQGLQNVSDTVAAQQSVQENQLPARKMGVDDMAFTNPDDLYAYIQQNGVGGDTGEDLFQKGSNAIERSKLNQQLVELMGTVTPENVNDVREEVRRLKSRIASLQTDDASGLWSALENVYRMFAVDFKTISKRAAEGAVAGTVAGTAVPLLGNVAGFFGGLGIGAAVGVAEATARTEGALFAADMLL